MLLSARLSRLPTPAPVGLASRARSPDAAITVRPAPVTLRRSLSETLSVIGAPRTTLLVAMREAPTALRSLESQ